ncbi:GNAT family N-acetyltransferase [Chromobacterium violaceum]|uniref:GNAT family N-acetyltransferase n=1 Tax=Chromobacterium violaceum TaxID=536 RepID=UPI0009B5C2C4|nr:GNAT family protein [Chromobacterium violaceum]
MSIPIYLNSNIGTTVEIGSIPQIYINDLHLKLCHPSDAKEVLAFEAENRSFFAKTVEDRGDDFFSLSKVESHLWHNAMGAQNDSAYYFLLRRGNELIGRINLTDIVRPYYNKATIGYRFAATTQGKGLATQGVAMALIMAERMLGLHRIETTVELRNEASLRVLQKNNFDIIGKIKRGVFMHGEWRDLYYLSRLLA